MTWFYKGKIVDELPEDCKAFVYIITNAETGKKYIGKKLASFSRKTKVKGKTRRKTVTKESDWKTYYGSSEHLKKEVEELGADKFEREILFFCPNKGTASYLEAKLQMQHEVLESSDFYNEWIMVKVHRKHIKNV